MNLPENQKPCVAQHIFWQCAAWRGRLDTRLENEKGGE